eukprot:366385-Chlamydomonas_euryale.AAC.2
MKVNSCVRRVGHRSGQVALRRCGGASGCSGGSSVQASSCLGVKSVHPAVPRQGDSAHSRLGNGGRTAAYRSAASVPYEPVGFEISSPQINF